MNMMEGEVEKRRKGRKRDKNSKMIWKKINVERKGKKERNRWRKRQCERQGGLEE